MTLDVRVHRDPDPFDQPGWRDLLARDPDRHVFGTPEWNRVWWEERGEGKELLLLTMERDGELVAVIPLYRKIEENKAILRFVGGIDLTDYLGPICLPADREIVAESLVCWLEETDETWDEFDAHNMPVPFRFAEALVERADRFHVDFALDQEETAAILVLPSSWDDYLAQLDSKNRHELRRKRRRLFRDHPDARLRTATEETLDRDLKIFVEMHRGAEGHKGHFMKPEIATFFERVAHAFMPLGWLRLDFLEIAEREVASTFSFELDDTFYLYNSAYEPDAGRVSPGLVLVSQLVHDAIERGLKTFDFLRGPERYKYQLGSQAVPLHNVRLVRRP
jgi:CelD/BcsL family acetyltransferase involved in cellulose biosynthesis